jgi:hypothetical protein
VLETNQERWQAQFEVALRLAKRPREYLPTRLDLGVANSTPAAQKGARPRLGQRWRTSLCPVGRRGHLEPDSSLAQIT